MTCPAATIEDPIKLNPGEASIASGFDFSDRLPNDTISSVTITKSAVRTRDSSATHLTVADEAKNDAEVDMYLPDGSTVSVAADKGVTYKVSLASAAVRGDVYMLTVAVVTVGGQTLIDTVEVVAL